MSALADLHTESGTTAVRDARSRILWTLKAVGWGIALIAIIGAGLFLVREFFNQHHPFLYDFTGGLYNAGKAILAGRDPYSAGFIAHQAALMHAGKIAIGESSAHAFSLPVYPAPANLAVVPLSLLPLGLAGAIFMLVSVGAMVLALRLLEIRDWRCYALVLISWPFLYGLVLGALGPLLVLGAAAVWRWRDRLWPPAIALASIVIAKVFPWPIGVWMLITKRYKTLAVSVVLGLAVTLIAWAVLGFAGMAAYPKMLSDLSFIQEGRADSLVAILLAVGLPVRLAQLLAVAAAGCLLLAAWSYARSRNDQRSAFGLTLIAVLTATPIVWDHYLVLLFIPIALLSPELSALWLLPMLGPIVLALSVVVVPDHQSLTVASTGSVRTAIDAVGMEAILVWKLCRSASARPRVSVPLGRITGRRKRAAVEAGA